MAAEVLASLVNHQVRLAARPVGLPKPADRANVIAYLSTLQ